MYGIVHYVYVTIHSSIYQLLECLQKDPIDAGSDQPNFKKIPLEKTKMKEVKRRHESTTTTTTFVPPLCHRCAILTTNAASYLRMQMLGSVAKSIKHST